MRCALLSNVNVESIARRMKGRHDLHLAEGFGAWVQELADPESALFRFDPAAIVLLLDGAELLRSHAHGPPDAMKGELDQQLAWIERAASRTPGRCFFVATLDVPVGVIRGLKQAAWERELEHHWSRRLAELASKHSRVYLVDVKSIVEDLGRQQFYSPKRWYLGGLKYSLAGEKAIAAELGRILDAQTAARKKCLVLDLDNTLWGGVIGEEGLAGLALAEVGEGARYRDFQRRVKQLEQLGVILGVVSKNNEADALEVFEKHPHMVLAKDDFAILKINWTTKPQNLKDVAAELGIGLDSLVFIDDSAAERDAVRAALPEVCVPEFPADTCQLPAFADQIYRDHFFAIESTPEDQQRTETYRQNARRDAEHDSTASLDDFLAALRTKITIWKLKDEDLARAAQLTQKTNQLNLTTRRYTEQDLQSFAASPESTIWVASVADKHGDNGKVFLAIVRRTAPATAELDTFLMSCRAMGRFIEDQILDHLARDLAAQGTTTLLLRCVPTPKNLPARSMIERLTCSVVSKDEHGNTTWACDLTKGSPVTRPAYAELLALPG